MVATLNLEDTTVFDATGQSGTVTASEILYFADGWGTGTVQLEVNINGVWKPVAAAITSAMSTVARFDAGTGEYPVAFRWNCTAYTSGDITTYIKRVG